MVAFLSFQTVFQTVFSSNGLRKMCVRPRAVRREGPAGCGPKVVHTMDTSIGERLGEVGAGEAWANTARLRWGNKRGRTTQHTRSHSDLGRVGMWRYYASGVVPVLCLRRCKVVGWEKLGGEEAEVWVGFGERLGEIGCMELGGEEAEVWVGFGERLGWESMQGVTNMHNGWRT